MALRLAALALLLASLAACGSDDGANGVGSRTPGQAVQAASEALGQVKSFRMDGYQVDSDDGRMEIELEVVLPGRIRFAIEEAEGEVEVIAVSGVAWMKGDRRFWRRNAGDRTRAAAVLADRWVRMPAAMVRGLQFFLNVADPSLVGRCVIGTRFGRLTRGRAATVGGRKAIVIEDAGGRPGTAPGDLYIAATGRPLPLHFKQRGRERPGGPRDPDCSPPESDESITVDAEYRFRDYDADIEIEPPKDVLDLERLLEQARPGRPA